MFQILLNQRSIDNIFGQKANRQRSLKSSFALHRVSDTGSASKFKPVHRRLTNESTLISISDEHEWGNRGVLEATLVPGPPLAFDNKINFESKGLPLYFKN